MKRVLIIQEYLPHYRKAFFERLRSRLDKSDIHLELCYSANTSQTLLVDIPDWAARVKLLKIGPLVFHLSWRLFVRKYDLIIVPQEVKYVSLIGLLFFQQWRKRLFAYWGHGRNFQSECQDGPAEKLKGLLSKEVDWWFAYNERSAEVVRNLGYSSSQITVVQNSVDTAKLFELQEGVSAAELSEIRADLGCRTDNIGLFVGGLYESKRLKFLFESAKEVRQKILDFEFIVIGGGPLADLAKQFSDEYEWVHYLGKMSYEQAVPYWCLSKCLMNPGLVGLVVVDSFALKVPIITTNYPYHSPEFSYIVHGENGLVVDGWKDVHKYADACAQVLTDSNTCASLVEGCVLSSQLYSVEIMAKNMGEGIEKALCNRLLFD